MSDMAGNERPRVFYFPTNPNLANVLGRTDFILRTFIFWILLDPKFPDFQVPRFPDFQTGPGPGFGQAWAGLGPGLDVLLDLLAGFRAQALIKQAVWTPRM